jgi:hypothetical protein
VTTTAIIVMIFVLGFVWGGLGLIMATAARKERAKGSGEPAGS